MIQSTGMSNPIAAIRPNFGMLTLKKSAVDISALKGFNSPSIDTFSQDRFQGDVGKELSARELAKEFG